MEKCIEWIDSVPNQNLEGFINKYLEKGYKFKDSFQIKGEHSFNTPNYSVYYTTYLIFIKP